MRRPEFSLLLVLAVLAAPATGNVLARVTPKELSTTVVRLNVEGCPVEIEEDTKMGPPSIKTKGMVRDLGTLESWAGTGRGARGATDDPGWLLWAFIRNAGEQKILEVKLRWVFNDKDDRPFGESVQIIQLGRGLKPGKRANHEVMLADLPAGTALVTVEPLLVLLEDGSEWMRDPSAPAAAEP